MRNIAIAVVAAAVIVGGGAYYGIAVYPNNQFRAGLDRAIATLPPGYSARYAGATYGVFSHIAEVTDLTISGPPSLSITETIAKITIDRPALDFMDGWNRAQANPSALTPDQALPVADRIAAEGIKISGGGFSGGMASTTLAKPRIYPWPLFRPGVPALKDMAGIVVGSMRDQARLAAQQQTMLAQAKKAEEPDADDAQNGGNAQIGDTQGGDVTVPSAADIEKLQKEQLDTLIPILRLEAVAFLALGYDGSDGANLDVTVALPDSGPAVPSGNIHLIMSKFHAAALDRGVGGANSVDGLIEELGTQGKISVDHAAIGNMAVRDAATRLLNGDPLSLAMLDGTTIGGVEMDGLSMTLPNAGKTEIQKIALSDLSFDHSFLKSFGFNITGLKQDAADADAREKALLQQLGLKTVSADMGVAFQWDADKKTASLHDVMFGVDKLGSISASADIAGIDPANPAASANSTLLKATVRYQDASLINRVLRMTGDGKKTAAEFAQMRQQYAAVLLASIGPLAGDPKLAGSIKAINDFARTPHNLTIALSPPVPLPLASLKDMASQGPQALVDALGLSVTANQ